MASMARDTRKHKAKKKQKTDRSRPVSSISRSLPFWQKKKKEAVCVCVCVTSLLLVRMSPNTVCVRACALVLAVVTCPFVITAYSREHE